MAVDINSFVWASAGIEPQNAEDAIYTAGDQPIAGYDNFIMWAVTSDIHTLESHTTSHGTEHEAGGPQQINLDGLSVGSAADIADASGNLQLTDQNGTAFVDIDVASDLVREFPVFSTTVNSRSGFATGNDIKRRDGDVIYDHSADIFHRAQHAQTADNATQADNAANLGNDPPGAYIQPDDASRTITGDWEYTNTVTTDIDGNATTANHADEADHATNADLASDSNALEGASRSVFTEHASDEDITGSWGFLSAINHVNTGNFERFSAVNVDDELTFRNGDNRFEFVPSPGGVLQSSDYFGYDFNNNYWNFGDAVYVNNEEVAVQSDVTNVENQLFDPSADYTITGTWTYNNLIDGTITNAEHASNADHALQADNADHALQADNADFATEAESANHSDRVDGYHAQEIIDEANSNLADEFLDVLNSGNMLAQNVDEISFDTNVDASVKSTGTIGVNVTDVDFAAEAEYANNADKVDGYHADEIINMSGGSGGGDSWTLIDEWTVPAGSGWNLNINLDSADVYERYKLVTKVEDVTSSGHYGLVWARINGDSRSRYNFMKLHYRNGDWDFVQQQRQKFWMPPTDPGYMNTGEMIVACPDLIDGRANSYPTFGMVQAGGHKHQDGGHPFYGRLETDYSVVNEFNFWPNKELAFYVKILGQNL